MKPVKRFIAGAVCPGCKQQDTLYIMVEPDVMIQHCTRCAYTARMPRDGGPEDLTQPVQLVDPREN